MRWAANYNDTHTQQTETQMQNAIELSGADRIAVLVRPDATTQRDTCVAAASFIDVVDTPEQLAEAVESIRQLKALDKSIEASRVAVKAPILTLQRAIDDRAKEFAAPVAGQLQRLDGLVNAYNRRVAEAARKAEQERREAAERARREEEDRMRELRRLRAAQELSLIHI